MLHSPLSTYPLIRDPFEHLMHEIGSLLDLLSPVPLLLEYLFEVEFRDSRGPLEESYDLLVDVVSPELGQVLVRGRPNDAALLKNLEALGVPREKGGAGEQLEEDAADCPDVDRPVVLVGGHDQLGRAVVARDDVGGVLEGDVVDELRGTEVTDLDLTVL